jgi:hypothetical protein
MSNLVKLSRAEHTARIGELRKAQDLSEKTGNEEAAWKRWEGSKKTALEEWG